MDESIDSEFLMLKCVWMHRIGKTHLVEFFNCDRGCGGVGTGGIDFGDGVVMFECWTRFLLCLKWSFKRVLFNKPSLHII